MTLDEILKEMIELKDTGDPEGAHGRADMLLEMTVMALARNYNEPIALEIVAAFGEVPKWYA